MFVKWTKTMKGWPLTYSTYHQETQPPYRHAGSCRVVRIGRRGVVFGRYTERWQTEEQAHAAALGARPIDPFWWDEPYGEADEDDGRWGCLV